MIFKVHYRNDFQPLCRRKLVFREILSGASLTILQFHIYGRKIKPRFHNEKIKYFILVEIEKLTERNAFLHFHEVRN